MDVTRPAMNPSPALTPQQLVAESPALRAMPRTSAVLRILRYSAAIECVGCLCLAGIGDGHDEIMVDLWEASRYDVDAAWPQLAQVAVVVYLP